MIDAFRPGLSDPVVQPAPGAFARLWFGESVSLLGTATSAVLLQLLAVVQLHATPAWLGGLTAATWLPWLVIGLPAGAWVDRQPPRRVMIGADLLAAAALISLPISYELGTLSLWQLLIVAALTGTSAVFFRPACVKLIPLVVADSQLMQANARLNGSDSASQLIGPGLAGLLARFGSTVGIGFDALSYCVSACCLWRIRVPPTSPSAAASRPPLRSQVGIGLRFVAHDRILRAFTVIGGLSNFGLTGFSTLLVLYWTRHLHLPAQSVGLMYCLGSAGGLGGALLVGRLSARWGSGRTSTGLLLVGGLSALLIGLPLERSLLWLSAIGLFLMDGAIVAGNALRGAWRQRYVPAAVMARVTTSSQVLNFGTMPVAAVVAGWLGGSLGPRSTILVLAGVHCTACFAVLLSPAGRVRELPATTRLTYSNACSSMGK